jgi:hypothetical protein
MQRIKPWLERDFSFDLPAWMFPHVIERVRGTPARLEDILRHVSTPALIHREGNKWSMQEEAGHLLDSEPLKSERLDQLISGARELKAWDGTNAATWNAQHNTKELADILRAFRQSRQSLVRRFDALPEEMVERAAHHPRLNKPMRVIDLALFIAEHDDYHLARISAAKRLRT